MKNFFLLFTLLFISITCLSQGRVISGKIENTKDNSSIPYVNIGISQKGVGTVSDADGFFNLTLTDVIKKNDTVLFSYIGFKTQKLLVSELKNTENLILLEPEQIALKEVIVKANKLKAREIGRSSKGIGFFHVNFYSAYEKEIDDKLGKERGMKFNINRNCNVKDLNFNITGNDFNSLKFRVNFYTIENNLPAELLNKKNIIIEVKDNYTGWFTADLDQYDIFLNKELNEVAVTIQWIESVKKDEDSKFFSISAAASPFVSNVSREKAMDSWNKSAYSLSFYLNTMCD
jgi:small nuclear ribonucleoprotein (snRNP)-like protein